MKSIHLILFIYLIGFTFISHGQQIPPSSDNILKAAIAKAAKESKNVFVIFHASWCGWCHKMDSSMSDKGCKKFFDDNYVICHLTVQESKDKKKLENPGAPELLTKYNGDDQGIPFWLIFDKDGNLVADSQIRKEGEGFAKKGVNAGCPAALQEVSYFMDVLKRTSRITESELKVIEKRFSENAL